MPRRSPAAAAAPDADALSRLPPAVLVAIAVGAGIAFQLLLGTAYVAATLDPVAHSTGVPVAVVNLDAGPHGRALLERLERSESPIAWTLVPTREDAVRGLEEKRYLGALVVPRDFSERLDSFAGDRPRAAVVETFSNPGASTSGNLVAQRAVETVLDALRARVREEALARVSGATLGLGALTLEQGRFLAEPIEEREATINAVPPNGAGGLAPTYIAIAAWIGGYMGAVALERFRPVTRLPVGQRALVVGGAAVLQAGLATMLLLMVGFSARDPVRLFALIALGTWMAYALVSLLLDLLGLPGLVPAFAVLALGLPASGAIYPEQMLTPLFQALHEVSPFTWLIEALRTALYAPGAGDIEPYGTRLALLALSATLLSLGWAHLRATRARAAA